MYPTLNKVPKENCNDTGVNSISNEAFFKDLMQSSELIVIQALSTFLKQASDIRKYHQNQ